MSWTNLLRTGTTTAHLKPSRLILIPYLEGTAVLSTLHTRGHRRGTQFMENRTSIARFRPRYLLHFVDTRYPVRDRLGRVIGARTRLIEYPTYEMAHRSLLALMRGQSALGVRWSAQESVIVVPSPVAH